MTFRQKWLGQSRGWVFILLGSFLWSLGLPQVGTLHHDHLGGNHPHVHADLAASPSSFSQSHHSESVPSHSHPHAHPHSHAQYHQPHEHYGVEEHFKKSHSHSHPHDHSAESQEHDRAEPAYRQLTLSGSGHWHTFTTLHRVSVASSASLLFISFSFPLQIFAQTFLFISTPFLHRPRAPPPLR